MRRGEPGETGRRGSGGAESFEAAPAIWWVKQSGLD